MPRPLKFGEPTVRREFRFPESLSETLTQFAISEGRDASDIVREALEGRFEGGSALEAVQRVQASVEGLADEIREKRASSVINTNRDAICINLPADQREKFEAIASRLGFHAPAHFLQSLSIRALNAPKATEDFLFGAMRTETAARATRPRGATGGKERAA